MRKDLKVAAKYFTTVSSLKINDKVAKLDLAPNYEEVPKPTDTEQVQQYLEKLLRLVTSNYENSFTHWGPALKNKNVKAVLRKPHAVRHFVKSHMKKDDTTALVEIGKLVCLFSSIIANQASPHAPPQPPIISAYFRTCIMEFHKESNSDSKSTEFGLKLLNFLFKRLSAYVLQQTDLPERSEEFFIILILECWEMMKLNKLFNSHQTSIEVLFSILFVLEKWKDLPNKENLTMTPKLSKCMHQTLQAMHMLIRRLYEQHPAITDHKVYQKVFSDINKLEQKVHIMCGYWTKLSIVPSTHGKLPSPKKKFKQATHGEDDMY